MAIEAQRRTAALRLTISVQARVAPHPRGPRPLFAGTGAI